MDVSRSSRPSIQKRSHWCQG